MKAKLFSVIVLSAVAITASAQQGNMNEKKESKFKKEKSYSKSYPISSSDKISLENEFGEMKLNTWDKNEVKVDVSITTGSDDEARAQKLLDKISIIDEKNSNGVSFKTKFANDNEDKNSNKNDQHHNENMKINYTVYLPASNPLWVKNHFGPLIVPDYRGEATMESQFGSLKAGRISNAKKIKVSFGRAEIEEMNNGELDIQYSTGTVNKLRGNVVAKFQFCNAIKVNIDNDAKQLDINNSYSTVYIDASKNFSATYDIYTSYGSFDNRSIFAITAQGDKNSNTSNPGSHGQYRMGPRFSEKYSGTSGSGENKLHIRSSFGQIILGHDLKVDVNAKKKRSASI